MNDFNPFNDRIIIRNQLVEDFVLPRKIPLVDLYSLSLEHADYYKKDGCHFNQDGVMAEGLLVSNEIKKVIANKIE